MSHSATRSLQPVCLILVFIGSAAIVEAGPATPFCNSNSITINDNAAASPYPSQIPVAGLSGVIASVSVDLTGLSEGTPPDLTMLLVSPSGAEFNFLSGVGGTSPLTGINLTLADTATSQLPRTPFTSGTYKPTNYLGVTFPSPAPAGPYSNAAPQGTATFASTFNGISPNGSWALYVLDHASGGGAGSISGGWCVNLTENSTAPTTTTVTSNNNPSFTASPDNLVTFTATVTAASGTPVTQGTVTFTNGSLPIAGCMNVALDGLGEAQCATSFSTEGSFQIIANYGGSPSFALAPSSGSVKQLVDNHPVVTGNQFCNTSGITLNDGGTATPYPSNIFVSGLLGTIRKVTLTLNGLTESTPSDLTMLLVGPNGRTFIPFSDVGGASPVTEINITLDDGAASLLQAPLTSGTFKPSNFLTSGVTFPSPAPAGPYSSAAPAGTATFGQLFNSTVPNGTWSLYIRDRAINAGTRDRIATWCLAYERELSRQQSHPGTREVPPRK